jgi:mono/diheme cytochrome c family protein
MSKLSAFLFRASVALGLGILLWARIPALAQSANEQLPAGAAKEKAEATCLTCHEARIMVQQRLTKAAWVKEMDKMAKWGAEVDPKDRDALIEYFSANFSSDQPRYEAPRTATESKPKRK